MSILAANLKHLYQRRGYWPAYLVFGLLAYWSIETALKYSDMKAIDMIMSGLTGIATFMFLGEAHFMGLVLLALPVGFCAAFVPIEVLSKPFSYCLPNHQRIPGKFIFFLGTIINMLGSLVFLAYPDLDGWQRAPVICSAFGAGLIMYWLGVWLSRGVGYPVILLPFLLPGVFIITSVLKLNVIAEQMIVEAPFEVGVLGVMTSLMGWWWLTNKTHARQFCAVPRLGLLDAWNKDKVERYWQYRADSKKDKPKGHPRPWIERFILNRIKSHSHPRVEEFFLNRMNGCGYLGVGRYIWGGLYITLAVVSSEWKWNLVLLLFGWYLGNTSSDRPFMVFVFPAVIVASLTPPIRTSVFTPQGRKERFITAAVVGGTITVLTATIMTAITALSAILAPLMQKTTFLGDSIFPIHAMDIKYLCLFVLAMPGALTFQVILHEKPTIMRLSVVMLLFFAVSMPDALSVLWLMLDEPILPSMLLEPIIKPIPIATFLVSSWLVFFLVLWYFCMKRPQVGQSRTY